MTKKRKQPASGTAGKSVPGLKDTESPSPRLSATIRPFASRLVAWSEKEETMIRRASKMAEWYMNALSRAEKHTEPPRLDAGIKVSNLKKWYND